MRLKSDVALNNSADSADTVRSSGPQHGFSRVGFPVFFMSEETELWKPIEKYHGYEASTMGRVRSVIPNK